MLKELYIRNYGLFRESLVAFGSGLNILTGETGAGKSLLVDAVGLIQGKRADTSAIFLEDDKCIVEARFGHLAPSIRTQLAQFEDFDYDPAQEDLILRREITASGKSRSFVNDTPVGLGIMREVSGLLLDLHGQHENQALLSADYQMALVDEFAGNATLLARFAGELRAWDKAGEALATLKAEAQKSKTELEYLHFQVNELEAAGLKPQEEENLDQEFNLLQHAEGVREVLGAAVNGLFDDDEGIYVKMSALVDPLVKFAGMSQQLGEDIERLHELQAGIQQTSISLQRLLETVESDPERLSFIEERLATYHKLKLKYGARTGDELIELMQQLKGRLGDFESLDDRIAVLQRDMAEKQAQLTMLGLEIESRRIAVKEEVETAIFEVLREIGFGKSRFEVAIERNETTNSPWILNDRSVKITARGFNRVYFLIQTNPGAPAGPLGQIGSGGEISRVMLAIKAALASKAEFPVLIFDEIDTGISGETAAKVGAVMQRLGQHFQIISITHLPQIAARGNTHLRIYKEIKDNITESGIQVLDRDARILEVAKMLSGELPSDAAMKNAAELIG